MGPHLRADRAAVAFAASAPPPKTAEDRVRLTERVMNSFDIPPGRQRGSAPPGQKPSAVDA